MARQIQRRITAWQLAVAVLALVGIDHQERCVFRHGDEWQRIGNCPPGLAGGVPPYDHVLHVFALSPALGHDDHGHTDLEHDTLGRDALRQARIATVPDKHQVTVERIENGVFGFECAPEHTKLHRHPTPLPDLGQFAACFERPLLLTYASPGNLFLDGGTPDTREAVGTGRQRPHVEHTDQVRVATLREPARVFEDAVFRVCVIDKYRNALPCTHALLLAPWLILA